MDDGYEISLFQHIRDMVLFGRCCDFCQGLVISLFHSCDGISLLSIFVFSLFLFLLFWIMYVLGAWGVRICIVCADFGFLFLASVADNSGCQEVLGQAEKR
jgi:hypothetical protein